MCNTTGYFGYVAERDKGKGGTEMLYNDDRTPEQQTTHPVIIMGTDRVLSGWGKAEGGPSFAGWACTLDDADAVERWVRSRRDLSRVRIVAGDYRPPNGPGHCHVYVVGADHPARRG